MDRIADRTPPGLRHPGERSAAELRREPSRVEDARRLRAPAGGNPSLDRLAALAARLLGAPAGQVSLLTDVHLVAGGDGLAPGTVGRETRLEDSLCTVTAAEATPLVVPDA